MMGFSGSVFCIYWAILWWWRDGATGGRLLLLWESDNRLGQRVAAIYEDVAGDHLRPAAWIGGSNLHFVTNLLVRLLTTKIGWRLKLASIGHTALWNQFVFWNLSQLILFHYCVELVKVIEIHTLVVEIGLRIWKLWNLGHSFGLRIWNLGHSWFFYSHWSNHTFILLVLSPNPSLFSKS
jgi:hypothetical protein